MADRKSSPWGDPARLKRIQRHGRLDPSPGPCANCGKQLDGWIAIEPGTRPQANNNSVSVCGFCGTIHEYVGSPLRLRRLTGDELTLALADPTIRRMRAAVIIKRATETDAGQARPERNRDG
jgi:hypothetical protein